ncbi:MAG: S1 RNA-binding domain-containing protein [Oscillospiraceae bacterium]|jgi:small subunit ribosomal protein S1|nr:S1 RNA-binding domain-containing protein [Oscillospiraceae bacterium]
MANSYKPEGLLIDSIQNKLAQRNIPSLQEAMAQEKILEGRTLVCDAAHNLIIELGCCRGIIPRTETVVGIDDGSVRDIAIISRVNKPVSFVVTGFTTGSDGATVALLSRKKVQKMCSEEYVSQLTPGDIIDAKVTHMESFGCFVDIGCGITSLIPIDAISISRISHPRDRFRSGQNIKAIVKSIDETGRVTLSHKELLGTWEENAAVFEPGETVAGIVRSVENYGIFVELTPNLAGLAESRDGVCTGQHASVYIKSLIPDKMKIKLIVVDSFDAAYIPPDPVYYIESGHLSRWVYSPDCAGRVIETVFDYEAPPL